MYVDIHTPAELGLVIRAVRRSAQVRLDDLAATTGVSKQFTSDVEHGKPSVQLGLVLKLLAELGVPLRADILPDAVAELSELRAKGGLPAARQRAAAPRTPAKRGAADKT